MSLEFIASAVIPLVVATLNLLVAGHALAVGLRRSERLLFAAAPAGVGIWALAWFVSVFNPESIAAMSLLGLGGMLVATLGLAADAASDVPGRDRGIGAAAGLGLAGAAGAVFYVVAGHAYDVVTFSFIGRLIVIAAIVSMSVTRLLELRAGIGDRQLVRWTLLAAVGTGAGYAVFFGVAMLRSQAYVDVLLFAVLLTELVALIYMLRGRVQVHAMVARAISYSVLSILVAAVAAGFYAQLGYPVDAVVVAVTVTISVLAAALFMGLSDRLSRGVERILFPDRARMQQALVASHGEVRAMRRRLERVEKLAIVGELAASVAHEIKNPLAPIRGYAQMLGERLGAVTDEERAQFEKGLRIIKAESERIDERVQELLGIARGDRDFAARDATFEVNRVVAEAAAVAEGEPGVSEIRRELDAALGHAVGDADEIRGALLNLMKNAAEAMQETDGSVVRVVTRRENGRVIVLVQDEGPGLSQEAQDKVFGAFYTTKESGTGLGLAIARSAVEAAGGSLTLVSREDERGAEARIELDVAEGSEA